VAAHTWRSFGSLLADVVFPGRCLGCGEWLLVGGDARVPVCRSCVAALPVIPTPQCARCGIELISERGTCLRCRSADYRFHRHMSLFPYTGMAKCLLQALKFGRRRRLATLFASGAAYDLKRSLKIQEDGAVIVPVPPRPGRREPDAVQLVAARLEKEHGLSVAQILRRSATTPQKSLGYEQRRANLRGGIQVVDGFESRLPRRVVVLDDVFTTGATIDACAQALLQAGCRQVDAFTLVMEE